MHGGAIIIIIVIDFYSTDLDIEKLQGIQTKIIMIKQNIIIGLSMSKVQ